jgi:dipeptidase D
MDKSTMMNLLRALHGVFNGVFAMSNDVPGLVETSSNLASVRMANGEVKIVLSQRSSAASGKKDVADSVRTVFELAGADVEVGEGYPGWKPNAKSEILQIAIATYKQLFNKEPKVKAIHAGLECGLFLEKYPHLDMISFGPTMRGVHSPDERLLIPTVELWWRHLVAVLENAPMK